MKIKKNYVYKAIVKKIKKTTKKGHTEVILKGDILNSKKEIEESILKLKEKGFVISDVFEQAEKILIIGWGKEKKAILSKRTELYKLIKDEVKDKEIEGKAIIKIPKNDPMTSNIHEVETALALEGYMMDFSYKYANRTYKIVVRWTSDFELTEI
ncbi:MAG: hypothetical protein GY679_01215 [Mycoplasma sp.]|nr:hypothetical protein [Mycoplasma sp.]